MCKILFFFFFLLSLRKVHACTQRLVVWKNLNIIIHPKSIQHLLVLEKLSCQQSCQGLCCSLRSDFLWPLKSYFTKQLPFYTLTHSRRNLSILRSLRKETVEQRSPVKSPKSLKTSLTLNNLDNNYCRKPYTPNN